MPKRKPSLNTIYISERVQECLRPIARCALTTVVAPMGYGKTTAINWFLAEKTKGGKAVAIRMSIYSGSIPILWRSAQDAFRYAGLDVLDAFDFPGDEASAGRVMEELCRIPVEADLASELRYRNPLVDEHTLLVVVSQSGETADTIAAMKECKARGARILAIVNVVGSTIAKLADHVIYTWAGPEIAVATTKGYTTQVAVLDMLAVYLARRLGKLDDQRNKELVEAILQFPSLIQRAIDLNPNLPALAQKYHGHNDMFFIGRNVDYAASMEGSLKLKEISYLHSEAYAAGELKHGTIALIEKDRPVIALACYEALFDKMMSNIKEVKARGAQVLAVVLEGNRQIFAEADDVIFVPRTEALFNSLPEIVPLQLFAYYVARANGCDIDKPKNLAKSVTVE